MISTNSETSATETSAEKERLEALFGQAGRRTQPADAKKQEWEALFRRELGGVVRAKRQQRHTLVAGLAAVMVLVVGVFLLLKPPTQPPVVVAQVVSAIDGNQTYKDGSESAPLAAGSTVQVGHTVRTSARGMLAIAYREADVRLNNDTTARFHAASIELISGSIYVDTGSDHQRGALPVIVTTPRGSFSHVGTQFMVTIDDAQDVTAAVREGTILLRTTQDEQRPISAKLERAELVRITKSGKIETAVIERHGDLWGWVVNTSPGKSIDGLSADEVLQWIAREMGMVVRYADMQSELVAANPLHAMDEAVSPQRALKWVTETTTLVVEDSGDVELLVSAPG